MPETNVTKHSSDLANQNSVSSEEQDDDLEPAAEIESLSDESRPGSSHSFLQLHPPVSAIISDLVNANLSQCHYLLILIIIF